MKIHVSTSTKRRSQLEILTQILDLCQEPQLKTRLMQFVNTSSEANTSYMLKLQRLGFIKATEEREYITTAKGMLFLEKWNGLTELVKPDPNDIARRKPIPGKAG